MAILSVGKKATGQKSKYAQWTSRSARTAQDDSERVISGLRRATNIVTVDIILIVISLRNLKIYISLKDPLSKVAAAVALQLLLL